MKKERFPLPDGVKTTTDIKKCQKAWMDIAAPICKATGAQVNGFDPTIQIIWGNRIIDFPVSFLEKLNESLPK